LYSYVSRGLIRSEVADERKRTRRYRREDVEKLKERKEFRRNPVKAVENALHWGTPVLESAITLIADNRLYYRGYDVLQLAANYSVEQVAALIWTGSLSATVPGLVDSDPALLSPRVRAVQQHLADLPPVERFQTLLPLAAVDDLAGYDLRPFAVTQTGARILHLLATIAVGEGSTGEELPQANVRWGIARKLQQGWVPDDPQAAGLLNAVLILCADHELNVSSFTARCVASAGATPYEAVVAGLAALQGVKHGRNTERVEAFLKEADTPAKVRTTIAGRLRRGETIPGFGHMLYPAGDPRGKALLDLTAAAYPESPVVALATAVTAEAFDLIGAYPNVDLGLVILAWTLNLPPGGPIALFALGRTIGWIGQAIEQYQTDRIIRPRARYTGQPPRPLP
jgi:citrate synthase